MIKNQICDIFDSDVEVILHQTNCHNCFGGGIARFIGDKYPCVEEADAKTKVGDKNKLGTILPVKVDDGHLLYVINAYGQYYPGADTRREYLKTAMKKARKFMEDNNLKSLGIPYKVGCGIGGGNWEDVSNDINEIFDGASFDVIICQKV